MHKYPIWTSVPNVVGYKFNEITSSVVAVTVTLRHRFSENVRSGEVGEAEVVDSTGLNESLIEGMENLHPASVYLS